MGHLRATLRASIRAVTRTALAGAALAACGGSGETPDSGVVLPDAPPDTPPPDTRPPDTAPAVDLSCVGTPFPTMAPGTVTAAGTVQEFTQQGAAAVAGASIATFKLGTPTAVDTATSAADGSFTTGAITTGGVPFDGYLRSTKVDAASPFRDVFVFPPAPIAADLPLVPVLMLRTSVFGGIAFLAGANQNDAANGALMVLVTDCASTPMANANLSVTQGGAAVGTVFSLGQLSPMAAGVYLVFNVPAGDTDVSARYMGMSFPTHRVVSFKNGNGIANGATTLTIARPGPL